MDFGQTIGSNRGRRAVPAPELVAHSYVIDRQRSRRRGAFNGALYCDTSGVYFLFDRTMDPRITDVVSWFDRIYLGGVPQLIRDETAFLSFICMLAGIEALSGYLDPDISGPGANGERFKRFIREHFPLDYRSLADQMWDFRNGMAHGFSPRQFALTHHNSAAHLQRTPDSAIVLNAEDFYAAFLAAAKSYFTALSSSADLQTRFSRRLDSRSGGGFGVGFVDRLDSAV